MIVTLDLTGEELWELEQALGYHLEASNTDIRLCVSVQDKLREAKKEAFDGPLYFPFPY